MPTDGVTNARPLLQAMIDAAEAASPRIALYLPPMVYNLTDGISLRIKKPLHIIGGRWLSDSSNPNGDRTQGTVLKWSSATAVTILSIKSATASNYLSYGSIRGVHFDGNALAPYGCIASSLNYWAFDVSAGLCTVAGMQLDDGNGVYSNGNIFENFNYTWGSVVGTTGASHGLNIVAANPVIGSPQNQIRHIEGLIYGGDLLRLDGVDNTLVMQVLGVIQSPGTGHAIGFRNVTGPAQNNTILYVNGPIAQDVGTFGNWIRTFNSEAGFSQESTGAGGAIFTVGLTINTSTTVSNIPSTTPIRVGQGVSGSGIQAGSTVVSISGANEIVISLPAVATSPDTVALVFKGPQFDYQIRDYLSGQVHDTNPHYVLIDLQHVRAEAMTATTTVGAPATAVDAALLYGKAWRFTASVLCVFRSNVITDSGGR